MGILTTLKKTYPRKIPWVRALEYQRRGVIHLVTYNFLSDAY